MKRITEPPIKISKTKSANAARIRARDANREAAAAAAKRGAPSKAREVVREFAATLGGLARLSPGLFATVPQMPGKTRDERYKNAEAALLAEGWTP